METKTSVGDTFKADVMQFIMPHGDENPTSTQLPIAAEPLYLAMLEHGCRFEAEMLQTREISVTITSQDDDIDISITPNGPDVQVGMVAMLERQPWNLLKTRDDNPAGG